MSAPEWVDAGPLLACARDSLAFGEILHGEDFSLQQAMSAVVIGAPKMDAGSAGGRVRSPAELIAGGGAPVDLPAGEALGVMDRLMALEASWLTGSALTQTVYTCLYMFDLERLEDNLYLSAFCKIVRATTWEIRNMVIAACVCEDEDFVALSHGTPLDEAQGDGGKSALAAASFAEGKLTQILKRKGGAQQKDGNGLGDVDAMPANMAQAIAARLKFWQLLHMGLDRLQKKGKQDLQAASKHFGAAMVELQTIRETSALGSEDCPGFQPCLDRGTLGAAPMRPLKILTKEDAWDHFQAMLEHLQLACSVTAIGSLKELKNFLLSFAKKLPAAVARSALHLNLSFNKGTQLSEPPRWCPSIRMLSDALNLPPKRGDAGDEVDFFLQQALIAMQNWCQCMCLNRLRQRRRLRKGLEDWRNLADHAFHADNSPAFQRYMAETGWHWLPGGLQQNGPNSFQSGPLMAWVEQGCCECMVLHLLLGCELELYQPMEYTMIFWYCDYLFSKLLACTRDLFNARSGVVPPSEQKKKGGKKTKSKMQQGKNAQTDLIRTQRYAMELAILETERHMSQGIVRLMLGLHMTGTLTKPEFPFNGEAERFHQRFDCFQQVEQPEPLEYAAFAASTHIVAPSSSRILDAASKSFHGAKDHASLVLARASTSGLGEERLGEIRAMEHVARTNAVAASIVMRSEQLGLQNMSVAFGYDHHPYFPVVSIARSKEG
ncbi:unnamed protein product [Ostreobium quekettii]|uniref:Uncharacterized protein n=1 Tax=Ostreobium quekettii TaxID=121088 RepID=A0A8S1J9P6_9CHLO|nr:unnamed protein product [Ostreobium quekettii]|eukprot:evm.model.scf_150EXC.9 EVM.evm.TU.scf_150EXC.9   scf_150EXC:70156-79709(-)